MSKNVLAKTNFTVCMIIVAGFLIAFTANFFHNRGLYMGNMEHISSLTSEGVYYRLESIFARPINTSLTMANDAFLIDFINKEHSRLDDAAYVETIQRYLDAYRKQYAYDSVFLVSTKTGRYYNFNGIDRTLAEGDPENDWYYDFLKSNADYSLDVDNDETAQNEITVFVDCAVRDDTGATIGVVGVGLRVDYLQGLLREYGEQFGVETFLVNENGIIEISANQTGYEAVNHFDACGYPEKKNAILSNKELEKTCSFWVDEDNGKNYVTSQYIPSLSWYLIVENNTKTLYRQMWRQFVHNLFLALVIAAIALSVTTYVIRSFNRDVTQLAEERYVAFRNATEQLFDTIYEVDVTKNRAIGGKTDQILESLGMPPDAPFDQVLRAIAAKEVKEEHREGYLAAFLPENVLSEYQKGKAEMQYEFQATSDGVAYHWTRLISHAYRCKEDDSIRMFAYFQNIESEKQKEIGAQTDKMTGLYNREAVERLIRQTLVSERGKLLTFFILDIDHFKNINDTCGHAVGDLAINKFAENLKRHFRKDDILGRIGGDEFVAFVPAPSVEWAEKKAAELSNALYGKHEGHGKNYELSASIGVAIAPRDGADFETLYKNADAALYYTKEHGKNSYTMFFN